MRKILLFILIIIGLNSFAQENRNIKDEVEWFIDTVKLGSNDYLDSYTIYVLNIYKYNTNNNNNNNNNNKYCCGMSYIISSYKFVNIKTPDYYFIYGNDTILVCLYDEIKEKEVKEISLIKLSEIKLEEIVKRLIPPGGPSILGRTLGTECCFENGQSSRIFYEDVGEVPYKSFRGFPIKDVKISRDSLLNMDNR